VAYCAVRFKVQYESDIARRRSGDELGRLGRVPATDMFDRVELDRTTPEARDYVRMFLADRDQLIVI
jgi:hypothetical protein